MGNCHKCGRKIDFLKILDSTNPRGFYWAIYDMGTMTIHQCVESEAHKKKRLIREADKKIRKWNPYKDD